MRFTEFVAWIVLNLFVLGTAACRNEPALTAGLDINVVELSMVQRVVLAGDGRRIEAIRSDAQAPFVFHVSGEKVGALQRCIATRAMVDALQSALAVRVKRPLDSNAARQRFSGLDEALVHLEVHDFIRDSAPFLLRILPPTSDRPSTYAVLSGDPLWFEMEGDVLTLLDIRCPQVLK